VHNGHSGKTMRKEAHHGTEAPASGAPQDHEQRHSPSVAYPRPCRTAVIVSVLEGLGRGDAVMAAVRRLGRQREGAPASPSQLEGGDALVSESYLQLDWACLITLNSTRLEAVAIFHRPTARAADSIQWPRFWRPLSLTQEYTG
jgi:hypothetical protein